MKKAAFLIFSLVSFIAAVSAQEIYNGYLLEDAVKLSLKSKVRTVTETVYTYPDLTKPFDSVIEKETIYTFDEAGAPLFKIVHSPEIFYRDSIWYTKEGGKLLQNRYQPVFGKTVVTAYNFNAAGKLSSLSPQANTETVFSYDKQGRIEHITETNTGNKPYQANTLFNYDDKGRILTISAASAVMPSSSFTYQYAKDSITRVSNIFGKYSKEITWLDKKGRETGTAAFDANGTKSAATALTYDAGGNLVQQKKTVYSASQGELVTITNYQNDSRGNWVKMIINGPYSKTIIVRDFIYF